MRHIGTVADPRLAQQAALVLLGDGMLVELREEGGDVDVWVHDDARVDEARAQLHAFLAEPTAPRMIAARDAGAARLAEAQAMNQRYERRVRSARAGMEPMAGNGWLTISLLTVSVIVAAVSRLGADTDAISRLFLTNYPAWNRLPEVRAGEVWRLFTPALIHFGALHLLFNGWMWWTLGQALEIRKGTVFFGLMVLITGVVSNLGQYAWQLFTAPVQLVYFGGLSGVLYALFGYAWTKGRIDPRDGIAVDPRVANQLLIWLVVCMTGLLGPIANGAHVMGLIAGVAWAYGEVARARSGG